MVRDDFRAVFINQLAQGLRSDEEGLTWFAGLDPATQSGVLREINFYIAQAHPIDEDVAPSLQRSGLKATHTPAVLLAKRPVGDQVHKIAGLRPADERTKAFKLLIALLSVADDRRRRLRCADRCGHWWHQLDDDDPPPPA
jgi:hypothetical protein